MRIGLVSFQDGIAAHGLRRLSSLLKFKGFQTDTYFYNPSGDQSMFRSFFEPLINRKFSDKQRELNPRFLQLLAQHDVVGVSGTTDSAFEIKQAIRAIKQINPDCLVVWGGVHARIFPEDAVKHADAVCTGEGEKAFVELLSKLSTGVPYTNTNSFWFKVGQQVVKNDQTPLLTNDELTAMPFPDYGFDLWYVTDSQMTRMGRDIYITANGSSYLTLWSLGCPFRCSYCSNDAFLKSDLQNGVVRYPSPNHIISELQHVLETHDYVSHIVFDDDSFLLVKRPDIERFAELYKKTIGLPFWVTGYHPLTIDKEKTEILIDAGMRKVRMGIQSGSTKLLSFYNRKYSRETALKQGAYLASLYPRIAPPFYDVIIDNPIETEADIIDTIRFFYDLARPFFVYLYSLRVIPGTKLAQYAADNPQLAFQYIGDSYLFFRDRRSAFMILLLVIWKPPLPVFNLLLWLSKYRFFCNPAQFIVRIIFFLKKITAVRLKCDIVYVTC